MSLNLHYLFFWANIWGHTQKWSYRNTKTRFGKDGNMDKCYVKSNLDRGMTLRFFLSVYV